MGVEETSDGVLLDLVLKDDETRPLGTSQEFLHAGLDGLGGSFPVKGTERVH